MNIFSFSASHRDLGLVLLERLSTDSHALARQVMDDVPGVSGAVVLATCNRLEVYVEADPWLTAAVGSVVVDHLVQSSGLSEATTRGCLAVRRGSDAAEHLFDVACGLDSMVIGEREITGQVRRALADAHRDGTMSTLLDQVFQRAARVSRQVHSTTELGAHGRSVAGVALDLAARDTPPWSSLRALLIGTGAYAGAVVAALRARGCTEVSVYSPSGRADGFVSSRDLSDSALVAVGAEGLLPALAEADLVVTCSGRGTVLDAATVAAARLRSGEREQGARRRQVPPRRTLVLIDLALAHDVDPAVAEVAGVVLHDLESITRHAPAASRKSVAAARQRVAAAVGELQMWVDERVAVAQIVRLRREAERDLMRTATASTGPEVRHSILAGLHADIVRAKGAARASAEAADVAS